MLSLAAVALAAAGLAAGWTGTWSPCGFSMIDTLGPTGHPGGRRRTLAACAAFALGAPIGGAVTFGGLAALGALAQSRPGGDVAIGLAVAIAVAAAALDALGVRIAPQLRRQVPESWRRALPLPLAAFLYGILLGLGFTTYVLSFALPALAAVSLVVADVGLGLVLGVAFGIGRALPIVALAPVADREIGARALDAMAARPGLLRGARLVDAVALLAVAAALAGGTASAAVQRVAQPAGLPSADAGTLAWSVPGGDGVLLPAGGDPGPVGGRLPAVGGGRLAYVAFDGTPTVVERASAATVAVPAAAGADALAVSARWLAWRLPSPDRILVLDLADPAAQPRPIVSVAPPGTLSRPALDGDRLAWSTATRRGSRIAALDLAAPGARSVVLRRGRGGAVVGAPSLHAGAMAWIRATGRSQELLLSPAAPGRGGRVLLRLRGQAGRDGGRAPGRTGQGRRPIDRHGPIRPAAHRLLDTALDERAAYVSRMPLAGGEPSLLRVDRERRRGRVSDARRPARSPSAR